MRILVVEDEPKTAGFLRQGFTESGFVVDVAASGTQGRWLASGTRFDLIILDVMLPGIDGLSLLRELRSGGDPTPVLLLTARDGLDDRITGLDAGADDYLVKPFAFSELLARVRSVLRRGPTRVPDVVQVADLVVNITRIRATRGRTRLDLTPKEFSLLSLLARRRGEVLSRTFISEQVWDMNFDSDSNVIDVHIGRLRTKLDGGREPKLIHTVRSVGYVLEDRTGE